MGIQQLGIEGERAALGFLKERGFTCFQIDWIAEKNGNYILIEVKNKERFKPPPFEGHGLDKYQIEARLKFYKKTGIRPLLLICENDKWIYQWLDILNDKKYFDTKNGIRIYPIENFIKC